MALLGLVLAAVEARADGPEVGFNAGVAVPTGQYADTADVGGTVGLSGGYRFGMGQGVSLSLIAQPQFTFMPTTSPLDDFSDSLTSMAILAAGPKLNIESGKWTVSGGGQGGYYRDMSGPLSEDGAGWNIFGNVGYEVVKNAHVGLFARYDQANLLPSLEASNTATRRIFLGGVGFDYVFAAPEPVAAAPAPAPPAAAPAAKKKIILRGVNFDFDKASIRPDAKPILDEAVKVLKSEPAIKITVDGHTDSIGSEAYNQRLSERRAASVVKYLEAGGIAGSRMKPIGHGESNPVATNDTAEGRAQNRRVELNVVGGN